MEALGFFLGTLKWVGFGIGVLLSIVDAILTAMILDAGGKEKNIILRWFIEKMGTTIGLGFPKLVSAVFVGFCVFNFIEFWWLGWAYAVIFGYISWRNLYVWKLLIES